MKIYRYKLNKNNEIEKMCLTAETSLTGKQLYILYDCRGKMLIHPFLKSRNIDAERNNLTASLYLSEEDDERAKQHFLHILSRKANIAYQNYTSIKSRCDQYQGKVVTID